jgi:hypothetical protein
MHDQTPFDPCRQWLGIDAVELVTPHRVLGVSPLEADSLVIVRAADQKIALLRSVEPGTLALARDALMTRVEQARDSMLAAASSARGGGFPASQPAPSVASSVSAFPVPGSPMEYGSREYGSSSGYESAPTPAHGFPQAPVVIQPRRVQHRPRQSRVMPLAITAILLAVAGGLAYQLFRKLPDGSSEVAVVTPRKPTKPAPVSPPTPRPQLPDQPNPAPEPEPVNEPEPKPELDPDPETPPEPEPEPEPKPNPEPEPEPEPEPNPEPESNPEPSPAPEPESKGFTERDRKKLDQRLTAAYAALRRHDFDEATEALADARTIAAADEPSAERVGRWNRLADYAQKFPDLRDKAFQASGDNEIELEGGRLIGIVEINDKQVVYRERGRTERVARDRLPDDILLAIMQQWFNGSAHPGNHVYLGVFHTLRKQPDLASARGEWQLAAFGGEQEGTALQPLLDDPVIKAGGE